MSRARRVKKSPTPSPAATFDRDSAKQTAELAAFRRMLVVSEGCFSLSFAVCDDRRTDTAWCGASGQEGIPCAFVIDRRGKVAFIGHPMDLDKVVAAAVAGRGPND